MVPDTPEKPMIRLRFEMVPDTCFHILLILGIYTYMSVLKEVVYGVQVLFHLCILRV